MHNVSTGCWESVIWRFLFPFMLEFISSPQTLEINKYQPETTKSNVIPFGIGMDCIGQIRKVVQCCTCMKNFLLSSDLDCRSLYLCQFVLLSLRVIFFKFETFDLILVRRLSVSALSWLSNAVDNGAIEVDCVMKRCIEQEWTAGLFVIQTNLIMTLVDLTEFGLADLD